MTKVHIDRLRVRVPSGSTDAAAIERQVARALAQNLPPHAALGAVAARLSARITGALATRRGR